MFFKFYIQGRERGAIGSAEPWYFAVEAAYEAEARVALDSKFEVWNVVLITRAFQITYENGDVIRTEMNATLEQAQEYYLNPLLPSMSNGAKAVKVEQI